MVEKMSFIGIVALATLTWRSWKPRRERLRDLRIGLVSARTREGGTMTRSVNAAAVAIRAPTAPAGAAYAAEAALDPSFGTGGKVTTVLLWRSLRTSHGRGGICSLST